MEVFNCLDTHLPVKLDPKLMPKLVNELKLTNQKIKGLEQNLSACIKNKGAVDVYQLRQSSDGYKLVDAKNRRHYIQEEIIQAVMVSVRIENMNSLNGNTPS
ncbi:MAG: hypothetical protein S4CHLAM20_10130 [Chlamydiia bacterium]|nr:hypothetical protein [Chlamydiia bacterium]